MNDFATEIISLSDSLSYKPVYINADKRQPDITKTTIKYLQVGGPLAADKIGNALGAIIKVEFVDLTSATATHVKIWGIHNDDASAVIYPKSYLEGKILDIVLDKFELTNAGGTPVSGGTYIIMGHRKNTQPFL
jgi:hypothetical protein